MAEGFFQKYLESKDWKVTHTDYFNLIYGLLRTDKQNWSTIAHLDPYERDRLIAQEFVRK